MKMQNTEMEFVAFDAQDVIATSGGPKTAKFTASSTLYDGTVWNAGFNDGKGNYSNDNNALTWSTDMTNTHSLSVLSITEGTTYVLTQGVTEYMLSRQPGVVGIGGGIVIMNPTEGDVADETLTSLSAIAGWLTQYGVNPFQ